MIWRRRRTGEVQKVEGEGRRVSDHVGDSHGSKIPFVADGGRLNRPDLQAG